MRGDGARAPAAVQANIEASNRSPRGAIFYRVARGRLGAGARPPVPPLVGPAPLPVALSMPSPWSQADHYENFPVGSWLLPAAQRPAVGALYRFARYADDVADEGDAPAAARHAELDALDSAVARLGRGAPPGHAAVAPLEAHARRLGLPTELLSALLSAFRQDVDTTRYPDYAALADYCRRSADPVGRLMLRIFGIARPDDDVLSDRICTGLQLVNFAQDVAIDWRRGRLYMPLSELRAHGVFEADIDAATRHGSPSPALRALVRAQVERARAMLESGAPLAARVPTRLAWELRLIVSGGLRICDRLAACGFDPFGARPALGARDAPALLAGALRLRGAHGAALSARIRP